MSFGTAIAEATALHRFLAMGAQLTAEELAVSLREVREQVLTDEDHRLFEQAVLRLGFPSTDDRRVPLDRIVRSIGGGQLRGSLGDRIVPLARFPRATDRGAATRQLSVRDPRNHHRESGTGLSS